MVQPKGIYVCIGWLLATIITAIIGVFATSLPKYYRLDNHRIEVQGTVISKERENHQLITVEYEVNKHKFKALGGAEDFGKVFLTVDLNEKVPVYYNPDTPRESCLGNPKKQLKSSILGVCFISIFPTLFFIGYLIQQKAK